MATGFVHLFPGGYAPDGSGSGNNSAALDYQVSSGTQTTNTPKLSRMRLLFDPATDEHWLFGFKMPGDYASGGTLRGSMSSAATSGNVIWKGGIGEASGANSDDLFLAADVSSATAVSGTAETEVEFTISLTMTSIAANDPVTLFVGRDADNASDTVNSNDVYLYSLTFEYTTS